VSRPPAATDRNQIGVTEDRRVRDYEEESEND